MLLNIVVFIDCCHTIVYIVIYTQRECRTLRSYYTALNFTQFTKTHTSLHLTTLTTHPALIPYPSPHLAVLHPTPIPFTALHFTSLHFPNLFPVYTRFRPYFQFTTLHFTSLITYLTFSLYILDCVRTSISLYFTSFHFTSLYLSLP